MNDVFNWFEKLFTPESYSKKLFTGSETHIIIVMNDDINSMEYIVEKFVSTFNISKIQGYCSPQQKSLIENRTTETAVAIKETEEWISFRCEIQVL